LLHNLKWHLLQRLSYSNKFCTCGKKLRFYLINQAIIFCLVGVQGFSIVHVFFNYVRTFACIIRNHTSNIFLINLY